MRVFIAIDLDERIRCAIADLQDKIKNAAALPKGELAWVDPARMHLTLKFLGEIEDQAVPALCELVSEAAAGFKQVKLRAKGVGTFGRPAKVLWVGLEESKELLDLQQSIESALEKAGFPREDRPFSGHLTLARVKSFKAGRAVTDLANDFKNADLGEFLAESVGVYKSQLTPDGPLYTLLSVCKLKLI